MLSPDELERLDRYLDGDSPPEERAVLARELRERPELGQGLDRLRQLRTLLESEAGAPAEEPADGAVTRAMGRRVGRRRLGWGWLVAAAVFVALGSWAYVATFGTSARKSVEPAARVLQASPAPGARVQVTGPAQASLDWGTAVFDGAGVVEVRGTFIRFDGRVAVSTEPSRGLAHVTQALDDPRLEAEMKRAFLLSCALVVFVIHGHAQAEPPGAPPVGLAAGQSWSAGSTATPGKPAAAAGSNHATASAGPDLDPGVDFHAFAAAMKKLTPDFNACFEKGLALNPKLQGDVSVIVHLVNDSGRGRADEARIAQDYTLENPFVASCLLEVVSRAEFPAPKRPETPSLSWPIQFSRGADGKPQVVLVPSERLDRVPEFELSQLDLTPSVDRRGPAKPVVVIYEFADFDCPFCAKAHQALDELYKRHQDRALFVFRPLELHPNANAKRAMAAVYAAGEQGMFWEMASALYQNPAHPTAESIRSAAVSLHLDFAKLRQDEASPAIAQELARSQQLAEAHHLSATPIVFINGREIVGARPAADYERIIEEELAAAKK